MTNFLSIISYHYVRPFSERFSDKHKFLELKKFDRQMNILESQCLFIDGRFIRNLKFEPPSGEKRAVWLTFDDGYLDHFVHVFPKLLSKKAVGTFFIPTKAIFERKLLDVNKVHILLALELSIVDLIFQLEELFDAASGSDILQRSFREIRQQYSVRTLLNDPDTRFVKFFLQEVLPLNLRKIVLDDLFARYVRRSESAIVDEIYMTPDHVKILFDSGMNIGSHGYVHSRYEYMDIEAQIDDVGKSLADLRSIGIHDAHRIFCYPYGSFNEEIKRVIRGFGCELAVSVVPGVADLDSEGLDWFELQRIDTKFFDNYFTVCTNSH